IIPPLTWTNKRKTYLQLALRLRRLGYCVVVPDITYFPEARIKASIIDLRLVLRWVGANISRYGATLAEAEEQISNGLNRVEIYEAEIELPPIAALAALFLGMGKSSTKYAKQLTQDIVNFVEL
ncbi:unnamed protein product, partial [Tilletia controversa]